VHIIYDFKTPRRRSIKIGVIGDSVKKLTYYILKTHVLLYEIYVWWGSRIIISLLQSAVEWRVSSATCLQHYAFFFFWAFFSLACYNIWATCTQRWGWGGGYRFLTRVSMSDFHRRMLTSCVRSSRAYTYVYNMCMIIIIIIIIIIIL